MNEEIKNYTQKEYNAFIATIDLSGQEADLNNVEVSLHTFDELYNGHQIDNPANGKYYYTVEVAGRMFLQNIVPFVEGNQPITEDNKEEVIATHRKQLIADFIASEKARIAEEYFSNK